MSTSQPEPPSRRLGNITGVRLSRSFWASVGAVIAAVGGIVAILAQLQILPHFGSTACDPAARVMLDDPSIQETTKGAWLESISPPEVEDPTKGYVKKDLRRPVQFVSVTVSTTGLKDQPLTLSWSMVDPMHPERDNLPKNQNAVDFEPKKCSTRHEEQFLLDPPIPTGRKVFVILTLKEADGTTLDTKRTQAVSGI